LSVLRHSATPGRVLIRGSIPKHLRPNRDTPLNRFTTDRKKERAYIAWILEPISRQLMPYKEIELGNKYPYFGLEHKQIFLFSF
jgi:hypothetical protein